MRQKRRLMVAAVSSFLLFGCLGITTGNGEISQETPGTKMSEINSKAKQVALKMKDLLTISEAVEIAYKAGRQGMKIPDDAPIRVVFSSKTDHFVVEFQISHPPGVRGADYHAQVTLDARSGKVIKVLGS